MNKKGVFYFFIAVIFIASVVTVFYFTNSYNYRDGQEAVTARIHTMNDFIEDLNNDAKKATYISAFRALIAMEEEIALTGVFFADAEPIFVESFYNGTLSGKLKAILNASSFSDYLARVNSTANDIGMKLDIQVLNVTLTHSDPWNLAVTVTFSNNVTDLKNAASWYYIKEQETMVPILDLRDPFYSVGTLGRVPNTIRRTPFTLGISALTDFVNDTDNANVTTNLLNHTNNSYYVASRFAPSYVMRLEGNYSNSTFGIESLVNILELQSQEITVDSSRSIVDYIYFKVNLTNASEVCSSIINTPSWFRIDRDHLETYEIDPDLGPENEGYTCA